MNKSQLITFMILIGISSSSCGRIYLKLIGVKKIKQIDSTSLKQYCSVNELNFKYILEFDSNRYNNLINFKSKDSSIYRYPEWWVQNHIQPTQVLYFNKETKKPIAAYFNCIAESRSLTNFTYNKNNELEFFPPLNYTDSRWIDTLFSYSEIISTVNDLETKKPFTYNENDTKYLILIIYSLAIEKQSTNLIREANYHIDNCIKDSSEVLYINIDNYLYYLTKQ